MKKVRLSWFPIILGLAILVMILRSVISTEEKTPPVFGLTPVTTWEPPDINLVPQTPEGELVRYGRELIANTSFYLGPKGTVAKITNGMNCQNCHVEAGTRLFGSPLISVSATYPKFRERSGKMESIEYRVNECLERSLNGHAIDSQSREMRAIVAYFHWLGKGISKETKIAGMTNEVAYINRAADPAKGKLIFEGRCANCHAPDGKGVLYEDSTGYRYPPLWGDQSFNVSAGLYRLHRLASFIKYNMPYTPVPMPPQLSDEEAWDVAAFIATKPRTEKFFSYDWPDIRKKPVDNPFGPYADGFTELQHKFGPFIPIVEAREKQKKVAAAIPENNAKKSRSR